MSVWDDMWDVVVIALLAGGLGLSIGLSCQRASITSMQSQAVERGVGEWAVENGSPIFRWTVEPKAESGD